MAKRRISRLEFFFTLSCIVLLFAFLISYENRYEPVAKESLSNISGKIESVRHVWNKHYSEVIVSGNKYLFNYDSTLSSSISKLSPGKDVHIRFFVGKNSALHGCEAISENQVVYSYEEGYLKNKKSNYFMYYIYTAFLGVISIKFIYDNRHCLSNDKPST